MFWWLFGKKEVSRVETETKKSFESVRTDIDNISGWIKHLGSEKNVHKTEIQSIKERLSTVENSVEELKNMVSVLGNLRPQGGFRVFKQLSNKQTAVEAVQTAVQTAVYTPNLDQFSVTERAMIWILLNTDMRLSYDDLAAMLGKEKSTVRSQINGIKAKNTDIIEEIVEKNGKKRVFIPENIKEILLKKSKVRVNLDKKLKKRVSEY